MRFSRLAVLFALVALTYLIIAWFTRQARQPENQRFLTWLNGDATARQPLVTVQRTACPGAPFILPADGFIGLLYGDPRGPYSRARPHQGIDIFSNSAPGVTPVYAAYAGYITREPDWVSSLIQRVPQDPLQPDRQIWLYYTHMADSQGNSFIADTFPPGVSEQFVPQGALLGYTGDYNGASARRIWVHLHFSMVLDDGRGHYRNELQFANTLDPTPYLRLPVAYAARTDGAIECLLD